MKVCTVSCISYTAGFILSIAGIYKRKADSGHNLTDYFSKSSFRFIFHQSAVVCCADYIVRIPCPFSCILSVFLPSGNMPPGSVVHPAVLKSTGLFRMYVSTVTQSARNTILCRRMSAAVLRLQWYDFP